ncbi:MAG: folate-binding protein YgfZ [Proteobacteria bacterium]|nr:folate-binding protein YgfZ [Pseudomonadota bacterium]
MNKDWNDYLLSLGYAPTSDTAHNDTAGAEHDKAENTDIICDLSHYSQVVIAGDDAVSFMQGQFTNDVALVDEDNSQLSAFCNNKGRMLANFRLFKHQQNYFISLKSDLVESSIEHLQNYVLRAHVAIQDVSEQLIHLGVSGKNAVSLLSPFIEDIKQDIDSVSHSDNYIAICVASAQGDTPRYEIFCSPDDAKDLWQKLSPQVEVVDPSSWEYLNIQAGLPFIDSKTSGEFVPQMVNMELLNGVSFTKGCYTGQEIVARMHYLGKLKKRCFKINIDTEKRPHAGDTLFAENARAGQNTGIIIQAEKNPDSGYDALAVIQIADSEAKLFLGDAEGPAVAVKELPYSFDTE